MTKAVNLLRVLSIIFFLVAFVLIYAFMPIMVELGSEEMSLNMHRENFFYYGLATFLGINILVAVLLRMLEAWFASIGNELVETWVLGLHVVINVYLTLIVGYIGVLNNTATMLASTYAYLNFIGPTLIFLWIFGLIYLVVKKKETT